MFELHEFGLDSVNWSIPNIFRWPIQRNKEESERLIGERDQITFIDLRFERWQVVGLNELC